MLNERRRRWLAFLVLGWLIRVDSGYEDRDTKSVARVGPGADGVAVTWFGERNEPIELLDTDCTVVGLFESSDNERWFVLAIYALEGRIAAGGTWMHKWNTPESGASDECAGTVLG